MGGVIERYTLPEMGEIWSEAHRYALWCKIETLVLEAHAAAGTVPADAVAPVRDAPRAARTHGVHAEPDSFGHRLADFAFGLAQSRDRLRRARAAVAVAKLSGAVGSYSTV